MLQLTFNPGLTLTGFRTTRPRVAVSCDVCCIELVAWHERGVPRAFSSLIYLSLSTFIYLFFDLPQHFSFSQTSAVVSIIR